MPILELYNPNRVEKFVNEKSGINWCFASAHVSEGDAYIALRRAFLRNNLDFFPPHGNTIDVVWDDGIEMQLLLEGTQKFDDQIYPKQLSTNNDKSALGIYLRHRINVSLDHVVTYRDLENYGRDHIEVTKRPDGIYYFDFSI